MGVIGINVLKEGDFVIFYWHHSSSCFLLIVKPLKVEILGTVYLCDLTGLKGAQDRDNDLRRVSGLKIWHRRA